MMGAAVFDVRHSRAWIISYRSHVLLVCLASLFSIMSAQESPEVDALAAISQSNNNFATSIYKVLARKEGNLFFSPLSMEVVLALTYMGAGGRTALEMAQGLHLSADKERTKAGFHALITALTTNKTVTLDIANKIYTDERIELQDEYLAVAREVFKVEVQGVDFATNTEDARVSINQWVASKTNNKIRNLLAEGLLGSSTVMVLVNAVYFKGDWAQPFDPKYTKRASFHINPTETRDVQMMRLTARFQYGLREDIGAHVLKMPYAGDAVSMVVMLPMTVDGLAKLEAKLPEVSLKEVIERLTRQEVLVKLPKFKLEESIQLNEVLKQLGMVNMFGDNADFSGLKKRGPRVKVSKVIHKAFVEVNEEGSEAAAATGVSVETLSAIGPLTFIADHPFAFFLVDTQTSSVLFAGRYAVPT